jgi:CRISPR/Cas system-associated endonuclease Cas1
MRDSNVANAAKESAQAKFSHGLYDVIELLRPRVDACVFRFLKSRPFDRKEFVETGSQVLLAQKTARQVALRVLAEVPASECEEAARRVARCILGEGQALIPVSLNLW